MVLLWMIRVALGAVLGYVLVTQVLMPLWRGTKVFPMLRARERELHKKIREAKQAQHEAALKKAYEEARKAAHDEGKRYKSSQGDGGTGGFVH